MGRSGFPYTTHRLSPAASTCSATKPPVTDRSTPIRGMTSVTADNADAGAGNIMDSVPAEDVSGTTTSSVSVARPVREMRRRGRLSTGEAGPRTGTAVGAVTSLVGRPSRRASRTSTPGGVCTLTQPSLRTSIVSRACPVTTASPARRRSYSTRLSVASTGGGAGSGVEGNARERRARYSSTGRTTHPSVRAASCADATCTHSTAAHRPIPVALIVCLPWMARGPRISFRRACLDFRLAHLDCQICNGAGSAPRVFHAQPRTHRASGVLQAARLRRRCAGFVDWSAGSVAASCGGAGG